MTIWNPPYKAMMSGRMAPITEAHPLAHQAHGINEDRLFATHRIPRGKGMPIVTPRGAMKRMVKSSRRGKACPWKNVRAGGKRKAKRRRNRVFRSRILCRLKEEIVPIFIEKRLPNPAKTSKEKMIMEIE